MARKRVAILISGRGSNMAALIAAAKAADYAAEIALVIASRPDAAGLTIAASAGIPTATVAARAFADKASFEAAIDRELAAAGIELICLAGFMRVLSAAFVARWHDRIINIHPSLLPAFPGLDTHARAIAAGVTQHGCTVHFVRAGVDDGPIIAQAVVPVLASDTPEELAARVLAEEHRLYPEALALVASGRARVVDGRVVIAPPGPVPRR
jgi:formyltetrahydrofolate-dependent phosphoribosylglycinamide formyltransferase